VHKYRKDIYMHGGTDSSQNCLACTVVPYNPYDDGNFLDNDMAYLFKCASGLTA
jgi:hypothetical protein